MGTDRFTVRAVVLGLIVVAAIGLAIMGVLALNEKAIPEAVTATTAGSLGGLTALLARTSVEGSNDNGGV